MHKHFFLAMNTESVFFKVISKILQRVPPPRKIQEGESSANGTNANDIDGGIFGAWDELSKTNLNEAINTQTGQLRSDFLRKPSISQTVHPNQRSVGVRIGEYLANSTYGSRLLSLASDSLFGQPYLIQPDFPCLSSSGLQHLSYIELLHKHWGIDLAYSSDEVHFIDYGGGYGNLARILVSLSDQINITILDIPSMLKIQQLFLQSTISRKSSLDRIRFLKSDFKSYTALSGELGGQHIHFHATFSLNESPLEARSCVESEIISKSDTFFIAYSPDFYGIDNLDWIEEFIKRMSKSFNIEKGYLPGYKTSEYVTGRKK